MLPDYPLYLFPKKKIFEEPRLRNTALAIHEGMTATFGFTTVYLPYRFPKVNLSARKDDLLEQSVSWYGLEQGQRIRRSALKPLQHGRRNMINTNSLEYSPAINKVCG